MGVSRLEYAYLDCITESEKIINDSGVKLFSFSNIWNNQIKNIINDKGYVFNSPSIFVEINLGTPKALGAGYTSYPECIVRFHVYHEKLNDQEGGLDRNFDVIDIRDKVLSKFNNTGKIRFTSTLILTEDEQDFEHTNVYHYKIGLKTNFTDNRGSIDDPDSGKIKAKLSNPTLNINVFKKWISEYEYFVDNVAGYEGEQYRCIVDNKDSDFNKDNWELLANWEPSVKYSVGDYVAYYSVLYKCVTENEDSTFTEQNWEIKIN